MASKDLAADASLSLDRLNYLYQFYTDQFLCDFVLKFNRLSSDNSQQSIRCHKLVLACSSPFFRNKLKECEQLNEVLIETSFPFESYKAIIDYFYTGRIHITQDNVHNILRISLDLNIESVQTKAMDYILSGINCMNCLQIRDFCVKLNRIEEIESCEKFIGHNFSSIRKSDLFLNVNYEYIIYLLDSPNLLIDDECEIFYAVMDWVKGNFTERKQFIPELVSKIKFPLLRAEFLSSIQFDPIIESYPLLRKIIRESLYYATHQALRPEQNVLNDDHLVARKSRMSIEKPRSSMFFGDTVICLGGRNDEGRILNSVEISNDGCRNWQHHDVMQPKASFAATVCRGKIYIVGGTSSTLHSTAVNTSYKYDPINKTWDMISNLPDATKGHGLCSIGNYIYVTGGFGSSFSKKSVYCLNTLKPIGSWIKVRSMLEGRCGHVTCSANYRIYCIGGGGMRSCEVYNPENNDWSLSPSMDEPRFEAAGCFDGNKYIFVAGGWYRRTCSSTVERLNVKTNQWNRLTSKIKLARVGLAMVCVDGNLYIIGGEDKIHKKVYKSIEKYDNSTNTWSICGELPSPRYDLCAVAFRMT